MEYFNPITDKRNYERKLQKERIESLLQKIEEIEKAKNRLIKLPLRFFIDHKERDLETPEIIKMTKRNVWIKASDIHLDELISDAEYYSKMQDLGAWDRSIQGIAKSAKATLKAIKESD